MKKLLLFLTFFFPLRFAAAQTVTLDSVSRTNLCVGESIWVYYSSAGSFKADNSFTLQLSDVNGSFATFTNAGHKTAAADSISIQMTSVGDHWRLRIIATDPYLISKDTSAEIHVVNYPTPSPVSNLKATRALGAIGFVGDIIEFKDGSTEPPGSSTLWSFGQDASVQKFIGSSPVVTYATTGKKTGTLTVSNGTGCLRTASSQITIINCTPVIPDSARIITASDTGNFQYVWVKAGGSYLAYSGTSDTRIFVEDGGSLVLGFEPKGIYYLKTGASFTGNSVGAEGVVILNKGNLVNIDNRFAVDTLYCDDLQFNYSQVIAKGVAAEENPLKITSSQNNLHITNEGAVISASLSNLLGVTMLSKKERDALDLELSSLADGVYVVSASSGKYHELRKILVVH